MWRNGTKGGKYERGVRIDFCRLKWVKVLSYTEKNQQFELSLFERQRGLSAVVSITNNRKRSFCSRVNHGGGGSREEKGGMERSSRLGTSRFIQKHSCAYAERKSWRKKFIGRVETRLIVLSFSPFFFPLLFSIVFFPFLPDRHAPSIFCVILFTQTASSGRDEAGGKMAGSRKRPLCRPRREVIVATFVITNHEFVLKI